MDRSYWEKIAPDYNTEIFDVLENDTKGIIVSSLKKLASKKKTVIDIGCAIGKWLPILSPLFGKVYAIDISIENLNIAKNLYPKLSNVVYERVDMSMTKTKIIPCDVAICINAILTASLKHRIIFFENLRSAVLRGGHLLLVIPSLESYMFTSIIRQRWNPDKDADLFISKIKDNTQFRNIIQGNAEIDEVPTKHYLKEELQLLLNKEGFVCKAINKIEYQWKTEFHQPPKWLKEPRPWDWIVLAKKQ